MLPLQFFGQNLHFAISLFAALVFFAVFWLYFDAWATEKRAKKELFEWAGFLLVSISLLIHATVIEQSGIGKSLFGSTAETISTIMRLLGYAAIVAGQLLDHLQAKPETKGIDSEFSRPNTSAVPAAVASSSFGLVFALPVGALAVAGLYWRRATKGLEHHLKPVALAFLLFFGFEVLSLTSLLQSTANPSLFNWVKPFGPLWIVSYVLLLAGALVLGRWVWRYLTERFLSQLFMIFTCSILAIFLLTTVSFTFLLMRNVQNDSLNNLQTAANVLNYALDSKKAETRANAEALAQNGPITQAVAARDHKTLATLNDGFLEAKKQSSLVITSSSGQVLLRAEDPERWGDSLSSDTQIRRAIVGDTTSSIVGRQGVLAPIISITTTVPIRDSAKNIIGTATVGLVADNALMDGIKNSTGLDATIYSGNTLAATTFLAPDGKTRQVGVKQNSAVITKTVLDKGQVFKGQLNILNRSYLAVYAPLKDANNTVVGMLFIGQPQATTLKSAGHSIELTFIIAVLLLVLSVIPSYMVARQLARQLE
jgi:hypothetical protein